MIAQALFVGPTVREAVAKVEAPHKNGNGNGAHALAQRYGTIAAGIASIIAIAMVISKCDMSDIPEQVRLLQQTDAHQAIVNATQSATNDTDNTRIAAIRAVCDDLNRSIQDVNKALGDEKADRKETNANVKNLTSLLESLRLELRELRVEIRELRSKPS